MLIKLGIDDHGFVATIDGDQIRLRSAAKYHQFMHEFQDQTFVFSPSLDREVHTKLWVVQALGELNVGSVNIMTK